MDERVKGNGTIYFKLGRQIDSFPPKTADMFSRYFDINIREQDCPGNTTRFVFDLRASYGVTDIDEAEMLVALNAISDIVLQGQIVLTSDNAEWCFSTIGGRWTVQKTTAIYLERRELETLAEIIDEYCQSKETDDKVCSARNAQMVIRMALGK